MIVELADVRRMNETDYRAERDRLRATYGETAGDRGGLYDQALARLFQRSGWTQEELAEAEGKTIAWVAYRLRFGRFLMFSTTVEKPKNLNEGRFRSYWEQTTGSNERQRFAEVQRLIQYETTLSKDRSPNRLRAVAEAILKQYADGAWHKQTTIVEHVEGAEAEVVGALNNMRLKGSYHARVERRPAGSSFSYRIFKNQGRTIDTEIVWQQLNPILQGLKTEAAKPHVAQFSRPTLIKLVTDLERTIEALTHQTLRHSRRSKPEVNDHAETVSTPEV